MFFYKSTRNFGAILSLWQRTVDLVINTDKFLDRHTREE